MGDGVAGVLPALVAKASRRAAEVLDVAVAIEVTVAVDPYEGTVEDVLELQDRGKIVGPAEVGGGQHEVQGGGVDAAVVGGVGNVVGAGEFPLADLVEYLARLLVAPWVVLGTEEAAKEVQRPAGRLGVHREDLVGGQDRIAPERRHVPGDPGRQELPELRP